MQANRVARGLLAVDRRLTAVLGEGTLFREQQGILKEEFARAEQRFHNVESLITP